MIDYGATFTNYTGSFPDYEAVNVSAPGAGDGTEFVAALVNDIWGRAQALLDYAGLTPDGVQEAPDTAQFLTAMMKGFALGPGYRIMYDKAGTPAANGDRVLLLQGQVIAIASYQGLVNACYVGDANNGTAPAYYKTSDAGGTTRSTSGTYFVLPDTRGLSPKGVGNITINGRLKTGPASVGSIIEDTFQEGQIGGVYGSVYYAEIDTVDSFNVGSPLAGYGRIVARTSAQGVGGKLKIMSDGTNGDPRTGTQTQDCTIGTNFGITY